MKPPLRENVRELILERIVSGELRSGSRIVESRLADELQVSRTPLREALFRLEQEGFVSSRKDKGFSVSQLSAEEIEELYPILWTLEGLAVRLSGGAVHLVLPNLRAINEGFRGSKREGGKARDFDTEWHETLISNCPNRRLLAAIRSYRMLVQRYEAVYMADERRIEISVRQHEEIIAALERDDIDEALSVLEKNWRFGMELLRHVAKQPGKKR